jgi:hypothetical protein
VVKKGWFANNESRAAKFQFKEKVIKRRGIVSNKQLNNAVRVAVSEVVVGVNIIYKSS